MSLVDRLDVLFDTKWKGDVSEIAPSDVSGYRMRVITSGPMKEVEVYPVWPTGLPERGKKKATSRTVQENLNHKNTRKKIVRLINTNFGKGDVFITLTYKGVAPHPDQARRDLANYIRRVKTYRTRRGLDELKYLYVIEYGKIDPNGNPLRIHIHIVMNAMDRNDAENLWKKGRANTRRLQPDDYGLEGMARYISKYKQGNKQWAASRNLKKPTTLYSTRRLTTRQAKAIAQDYERAARLMRRQFPSSRLLDIEIRTSDYCSGVYMYARMRRET